MLYYIIPVSANIPLFTAMRTVVLNFYIIVIIFLIFYVNKKTFVLAILLNVILVIRVILVILKNDEIQDNFVMPLLWTDRPNHSTQQATI